MGVEQRATDEETALAGIAALEECGFRYRP